MRVRMSEGEVRGEIIRRIVDVMWSCPGGLSVDMEPGDDEALAAAILSAIFEGGADDVMRAYMTQAGWR